VTLLRRLEEEEMKGTVARRSDLAFGIESEGKEVV